MTIIDTTAAAALLAVVALAVMLGLVAVTVALSRSYAAGRTGTARPSMAVRYAQTTTRASSA